MWFFHPFDPNKAYHDIKDIIEVKTEEKERYRGGGMLAGGALIIAPSDNLFIAKEKTGAGRYSQQVQIDPYKEAMEELDKLRKEKVDRQRILFKAD